MASLDPSSLAPDGSPDPAGNSDPAAPSRATAGHATAGREARPYDFRNPCLLPEAELRRLKALHDEYARALGSRLSLALRMELNVTVAGFATMTYARFTETLAQPGHLGLFKIDPLPGVGLLDLDVPFALAIADRLLGGRGTANRARSYLTEIETALLEDVVACILDEWCALWRAEPPLRATLVGQEHGGRFLQTSPRDAIVVAVGLECALGEFAGRIQIGLPFHTIEPVIRKMQARPAAEAGRASTPRQPGWHAAFNQVAMPVRAEWQAFELSLREIASLRVGDVIEMQPQICSETRVLLNGVPKFIGAVGLDSDRVAVQLTRKITAE